MKNIDAPPGTDNRTRRGLAASPRASLTYASLTNSIALEKGRRRCTLDDRRYGQLVSAYNREDARSSLGKRLESPYNWKPIHHSVNPLNDQQKRSPSTITAPC